MALYSNINRKETLSPGGRGEIFQVNMPGFRDGEDRIARTNNHLPMTDHDTLNIKYDLDHRLPVLFDFGFAFGYNQIVVPKGRFVAIDPNMNQLDFDTKKAYNVLTLANGGNLVKLSADKKNWENVVTTLDVDGITLKEGSAVITVDASTGKVALDGVIKNDYRVANRPIGMIMRNEYTRNDDAFNGINPGAVVTDKIVELPLFLTADKAKGNPWGSVYGSVMPGDYVKCDANGRLIPSPLNSLALMTAAGITTAQEIEIERQQIVGQIVEVSRDLVPAGAARFAQWALEDRMKFDQFNPLTYRGNGRDGEDVNENSPYGLKGGAVSASQSMTGLDPFKTPGYPYDQTFTQHDLHMLASTVRKNDLRMGLEYQLENGIPGLTDGYNAYSKQHNPEKVNEVKRADSEASYVDMFSRTSEVDIEKGSLEIAITTKTVSEVQEADFTKVTTVGQELIMDFKGTKSTATLEVSYFDELQGLFVIKVKDRTAHHTFLEAKDLATTPMNILVRFKKRGLAGVPTFMDWDGCQGRVSVLLQK